MRDLAPWDPVPGLAALRHCCCLPRGCAGVVVSVLRVITKAILPDTEQGLRQSANLYFSLAALVCAACTVV